MKRFLCALAAVLFISPAQAADINVYTDFASWSAAVANVVTIDFETPDASSDNVLLTGNEYSGLAGSPVLDFTPTPGLNPDDNLQVGEAALEVGPSSGDQLLFPGLFKQGVAGSGGVVRLSAAQPLSAVGLVFSDVERGRSSSGFDLDLDGTIDVLFEDYYPASGEAELLFLGFVTDAAVAAVDIHINSANPPPGSGADGVGADDLSFSVAPVVATASGYAYELIFSGRNASDPTLEERVCPGLAINNSGEVVYRTGQQLGNTQISRINLYRPGQGSQVIFETSETNASPEASGIQCPAGARLGINDDGVVAIPLQWVTITQQGNIDQILEQGYALFEPGVGIIREIRDGIAQLQGFTSGRLNNDLQIAYHLNGVLKITDGISTQSASFPGAFGEFQDKATINNNGAAAVFGTQFTVVPSSTDAFAFQLSPPDPISILPLGNIAGGDGLAYSDSPELGFNDLGWTSFSTSRNNSIANDNPRVQLIDPAGNIFIVAQDEASEFANFAIGGANGTGLNKFNRVLFAASLDSDTRSFYYVGDTAGDPPRLVIDDVVDFPDGSRFEHSSFANEVSDHGSNSFNDLGEIAVMNIGALYDASGTLVPDVNAALWIARPAPGLAPGNPIIPDPADAILGGGWRFRVGCPNTPPGFIGLFSGGQCFIWGPSTGLGAAIPGGTPLGFFDPPVATGYTFTVEGDHPNFGSVLVPAPLAGGDSEFFVEVNGSSFPIVAGQTFDFFSQLNSEGVASFQITGIDAAEALDPDDPEAFVAGLRFMAPPGENDAFTMVPIVEDTTDTDEDGVGDSFDNCPIDPNPNQLDGDEDDVGDLCDSCPDTAPGAVVDAQGCAPEQLDADGDGVPDVDDNCSASANTNQLDTDGDNYGNVCDADLNNSGLVNFADLALFKSEFGTVGPDADLDGNGFVNFADLARFKSLFGQPPGPSGLAP